MPEGTKPGKGQKQRRLERKIHTALRPHTPCLLSCSFPCSPFASLAPWLPCILHPGLHTLGSPMPFTAPQLSARLAVPSPQNADVTESIVFRSLRRISPRPLPLRERCANAVLCDSHTAGTY
eukprot:1175033-Pleurochrysis_carterae.AAC.1